LAGRRSEWLRLRVAIECKWSATEVAPAALKIFSAA
jgi:hypothetical protein